MNPVEETERLVAKIVARLKANGAFHEEIYASRFFPDMAIEERILFQAVAEWLEKEGIIRVRNSKTGGALSELILEAVLTSKGYAVLSQTFSDGQTVNDAIEEVNNSGAGLSGLGEFIGGILGGFTKSISS